MAEQLGTLCFHQKFQNFQMGPNGKGNFLEKFSENLKIVKFLKHYPLTENSRMKIKWNRNFW